MKAHIIQLTKLAHIEACAKFRRRRCRNVGRLLVKILVFLFVICILVDVIRMISRKLMKKIGLVYRIRRELTFRIGF